MIIPIIESLYIRYKYSQPSEKASNVYKKCYFKALKAEELTDEELITGENRLERKADLEFFVLRMILKGIKWSDIVSNPAHWYWKSDKPECSGLILLREWFN